MAVNILLAPESPSSDPAQSDRVKRPMNAFLVWSKYVRKEHSQKLIYNQTIDHAQLSKELGSKWKTMPKEEKQPFYDIAEHLRAQHKLDYPNYRYQPKRIKKCARTHPYDAEQSSVLLPPVQTQPPSHPYFQVYPVSLQDYSSPELSTLEQRLKDSLQSINQSIIPYIQNYPIIIAPNLEASISTPSAQKIVLHRPSSPRLTRIQIIRNQDRLVQQQQQSQNCVGIDQTYNLYGNELVPISPVDNSNFVYNESSIQLSPPVSNYPPTPCSTGQFSPYVEQKPDFLTSNNNIYDNLANVLDWPPMAGTEITPTWLSNDDYSYNTPLSGQEDQEDYLSFLNL
ncbi:unnamed protein product [Didymodactylos carnosus]|uniref:Sex-determining region Y protein n=1 Tax=Didymodactylos carnosus TaxID=1234261 RepID=A0A813VKH4_9BILA|nr:unnamed protein product [Didymodactylos carnosus]CAF3631985.1 unnamed protein product [Didymodactylos carnosus]